MGGAFICFKLELCLCDLSVPIAVLVGEHVVNDAIRIEARSQAAFALVHLPQDVVGKLRKQRMDRRR